jgi:hypothetical protein
MKARIQGRSFGVSDLHHGALQTLRPSIERACLRLGRPYMIDTSLLRFKCVEMATSASNTYTAHGSRGIFTILPRMKTHADRQRSVIGSIHAPLLKKIALPAMLVRLTHSKEEAAHQGVGRSNSAAARHWPWMTAEKNRAWVRITFNVSCVSSFATITKPVWTM